MRTLKRTISNSIGTSMYLEHRIKSQVNGKMPKALTHIDGAETIKNCLLKKVKVNIELTHMITR
jgi:hypothetical protein